MADISLAGTILTMAGSIIGGGATGYFAARNQSRLAIENWQRARSDTIAKLAADLVRDTAIAIAAAGHSACWLTWKARHDPGGVTDADISAYDKEMHDLLPKIFGGQAALATIDPETGRRLLTAVHLISEEDVRVGEACLAFRRGDRVPLGDCHDKVNDAYVRCNETFTGLGSLLFTR